MTDQWLAKKSAPRSKPLRRRSTPQPSRRTPPAQPDLGKIICSGAAAGRLLGATQADFDQRVADGWIKATAKDRYQLGDVVRGQKAFLLDKYGRNRASAAASRAQDQRARLIELRTLRDQGKLIEMEDVEMFLSETIGAFRTELAGVPAASSRDLSVRAVIENRVNVGIERMRARLDTVADEMGGN